jgi:hypothetical protein
MKRINVRFDVVMVMVLWVMTPCSLVVWHTGTHSTGTHKMKYGSGVKAWLFKNKTNIRSRKMGRTNQEMHSEGEMDFKH